MPDVNTHGYTMKNGRHAGKLITRVPISYLKWMVCARHSEANLAQAELDRRGTVTPDLDVSGHALDRASLCLLDKWRETKNHDEGLHAWLCRISADALKSGERKNGRIHFNGMRLVFEEDGVWPVLKTIMRDHNNHHERTTP
jgi:hypothetical protein